MVAALDAFRARGGIVLLLGDPPRRRATLAGGLLTLGDAEPMPLRGAGVVRTVDGAVAALARAARAAAASAGERARARAAALATSGAGG